jgi:Flp pilus assembly protein CpaB
MSGINTPGFPPGGLGMPPGGQIPGGMSMPGMPGTPAPAQAASAATKRKGPTRRVIGVRQTLAILLAVAAIAVFALAGLGQESPDAHVLRATSPISELTEVTADMIEIVPIGSQYVEEGALGSTDREALESQVDLLVGQVTRYPIERGQQLRAAMFTGPSGELRTLAADERLVSVPASLANAVAGSLRPGDRVDLLVVDRREGIAGLVATDIEIVAIRLDADQLYNLSGEQAGEAGRELRPDQLQPVEPIPGMYTLRVKSSLMPLLAVSSAQGELHLFYRGAGAEDLPLSSVSLIEHLCRVTVVELRPQVCAELNLEAVDEFDPFGLDADGFSTPTDGAQS